MSATTTVPRQPSLLECHPTVAPRPDASFATLHRRELAAGAWLDHAPAWLSGSDDVFEAVLAAGAWSQPRMRMYDQTVDQPRLSSSWSVGTLPAELDVLRRVGALLSARYRLALTQVSANLYRDGRDSVAWHGDTTARDLPEAVVAVLSLGHRRPFRLRPRGGGPSLHLDLGRGDLVVMGGSCQRTWQHAVPKVRDAGPRIAVMFRVAWTDEELALAAATRRARRSDPRTA